jgi:hypothetical protein
MACGCCRGGNDTGGDADARFLTALAPWHVRSVVIRPQPHLSRRIIILAPEVVVIIFSRIQNLLVSLLKRICCWRAQT